MSSGSRRIFWGQSLAQAVARAARYHAVPVDRLAYRVHEKRHGFVKHPRKVLIEVDPAAPRRLGDEPPAVAPAPTASAPVARSAEAPRSAPRPERPDPGPARPAAGPPAREPVREPAREPEHWDAPDEESLYAAAAAARQIARFAGLDLSAEARIAGDRLEVELVGPDLERLREAGFELVEDLEHLLPRAVQTLAGRHVRCRLDAGGLREAREGVLRARAREAAERALAEGRAQLLEPLNPAERRIVHLELVDRPGVATESLGNGFLKKVKIFPTSAAGE